MRQVISRQVAITEVWLDERARAMEPALVRERRRMGVYGLVGTVAGIIGTILLILDYWRAF